MPKKPKQREHNEYFRCVFVKTVYGMKTREPALVNEILARPSNTIDREYLETPYKTVVGYESSRKSCPTCGEKLAPGRFVYSWGEYVRAKWSTVEHFCHACVETEVIQPLKAHDTDCGCRINIVSKYGEELPEALVNAFKHEESCDA
jgi:hypothetical protein